MGTIRPSIGKDEFWAAYKQASPSPVKREVHAKVLKRLNELLSDALAQGHRVQMGYRLGSLVMTRKRPKILVSRVNWMRSKEKKRELEAQGIPLYDASTGEGEEWVVMNQRKDYSVYLKWDRKGATVQNNRSYVFHRYRGKRSAIRKAALLMEKNDLHILNFRKP